MSDAFRRAPSGQVSLCTEAFGDPGSPAIILIMGATASMMWWPDQLCQSLAAAGRFVVRFDHRDTGASTTLPPGPAAYDIADLSDDAIAILDAYGVRRGHLVGMSLGAMVAQAAALRRPNRISSLTLIAAEPLGGAEVPQGRISPAFLEHFSLLDDVDWRDDAAAASFLFRVAELSAAPGRGADRPANARRIVREIARAASLRSAFNHATIAGDIGDLDLRDITQPTLVIHGAQDPIVASTNGEAIRRQIPGATLHILPEAGHELHSEDLSTIARLIIDHTAE